MATIYIRDLVISARHGVHEHEKQNDQRFCVSVEFVIDTTKAGISDNLADTADWSAVRKLIISVVKDNCFSLMERLAQEVADQMLRVTNAERVVVSIDKIDAYKDCVPGIRLELEQMHFKKGN